MAKHSNVNVFPPATVKENLISQENFCFYFFTDQFLHAAYIRVCSWSEFDGSTFVVTIIVFIPVPGCLTDVSCKLNVASLDQDGIRATFDLDRINQWLGLLEH